MSSQELACWCVGCVRQPRADVLTTLRVLQGGGRGLNRYIKKKSLDPLDTYVPPVLQARQQLQKSGEIMGACDTCTCTAGSIPHPRRKQCPFVDFYDKHLDTSDFVTLMCAGKDAGSARSLLREGAFDGLRDNIRCETPHSQT